MKIQAGRWSSIVLFTLLAFALAVPAMAQDQKPAAAHQELFNGTSQLQVAPGREAKVRGTIMKRSADSLILRDFSGSTIEVSLAATTEVKERKSNPFRRAKNYGQSNLLPGLDVEVIGHGTERETLLADEIRLTQDNLRLASTIDARVSPVEERLGGDENRLHQTEENALALSGQVSEVSSVSEAARSGAKSAQKTADTALESAQRAYGEATEAKSGVSAANERISALDDYETKDSVTVNFKLGSAMLDLEARKALDKLAEAGRNEKGYAIEVAGFASADGNEAWNVVLSQRRADAVIRYLAENHFIPLRRFITPFGYGAKQPVADNKTREGRIQNRRVEVRILVSKGLVQSASSAVAMK